MRRSKQNLDKWIDQLASGETGSSDGDVVAAFVRDLGSDSLPGDSIPERMPGILAAEALSVTGTVPTRTGSSRVTQPLASKWRRRTMVGAFLSTLLGKVAIATMAIAVAGGGLATSDNLPDPAQEWVSEAVSHIGIDIPAPSDSDLPSPHDEAETPESPEAPELPEDASDTADAVTHTVFEGDPADGKEFGASVADTASDGKAGNGGNANENAGDPGSQSDDHSGNANENAGDPGSQSDDHSGNANKNTKDPGSGGDS
jgi:hypothetical protein